MFFDEYQISEEPGRDAADNFIDFIQHCILEGNRPDPNWPENDKAFQERGLSFARARRAFKAFKEATHPSDGEEPSLREMARRLKNLEAELKSSQKGGRTITEKEEAVTRFIHWARVAITQGEHSPAAKLCFKAYNRSWRRLKAAQDDADRKFRLLDEAFTDKRGQPLPREKVRTKVALIAGARHDAPRN